MARGKRKSGVLHKFRNLSTAKKAALLGVGAVGTGVLAKLAYDRMYPTAKVLPVGESRAFKEGELAAQIADLPTTTRRNWSSYIPWRQFGRRRRSKSRSRRRRSGRRGNPQAAAAMRLSRSKGISLKKAWAIVKSGKGGRRKSSRRRSRRRRRRSRR